MMDFEAMRMTIFLPCGVLILVLGGILMVYECKDDMPSLFKRLLFVFLVIIAISQFSILTNGIHTIMKSYIDSARPDWMTGTNIFLATNINVPDDPELTVFSIFAIKELYLAYLGGILNSLIGWVLWLPNTIREFSILMIEMILSISFVLSPLMLSFLVIRKTESIGWSFLMGSIGLSFSTIVFPLIDLIFAQFWGRILIAAAASVAPAGVSGGFGLVEYLSKISSMVASRSLSGTACVWLIGVLGMFLILVSLIAITGYFIAPFAFVKILTGGGVVSGVASAFSFMTGQAQHATQMGLEGMEAGSRGIGNMRSSQAAAAGEHAAAEKGNMSAMAIAEYANKHGMSMNQSGGERALNLYGGDERSARRAINYGAVDANGNKRTPS